MKKKEWKFEGIVGPKDAGKRLDVFLFSKFFETCGAPEQSRNTFARSVRNFGAIVNNRPVNRPNRKLRSGDRVAFSLHEEVFSEVRKKSVPVPFPEILFENEQFLILEKPAHLETPLSSTGKDSVLSWFLQKYPKEAALLGEECRFGLVHRLDRETSGVVVLAKQPSVWKALKILFEERKVQKTYRALVYGNLSKKIGSIQGSIARIPHTLRRRVAKTTDTGARTAETKYTVEKRFSEFDLVTLFPKSGRTHQIRVHLLSIGHPVVGDSVYGRRLSRNLLGKIWAPKRHLLHASGLSFNLFGKFYHFSSELPEDFLSVLRALDEEVKTR